VALLTGKGGEVKMTADFEELRRALLALEGPQVVGPDAVSKEMIRHWCEAHDDANPLYTDEKYAKESRYGGIIAPPQMIQGWTFPPLWPDGQEMQWRHPEIASDREPMVSEQVYAKCNEAGYLGTMAVSTSLEFFEPLHPGDRVTRSMKVVDVTPEKQTRAGIGPFVTFLFTDTNQKGELVCKQTVTVFKFKPA